MSTIAALTMLIIALLMGDLEMAIICGALVGACVGFIPYNRNPAKMFMGDTGATFLGYMLATISVTGLFKLYAIISFIVPFIILGFPIFDTASAFTRRILKGQNPMKADRSHTHHKLIDMGMNQKQAVATLYMVSAVLGLCAVMVVSSGYVKVRPSPSPVSPAIPTTIPSTRRRPRQRQTLRRMRALTRALANLR